MNQDLAEFRLWVDSVYGIYLDAWHGFPAYRQELEKQNAVTLAIHPGLTISNILHASPRLVRQNQPSKPIHLHQAPMEKVIERNARDGDNCIFMGRMAIVAIYGQWEDHTRKNLENEIFAGDGRIDAPIMGDIRILRRFIVHNNSRANNEAQRLQFLKWVVEGQTVAPNKDQIEDMIDKIMAFVAAFTADPLPFRSTLTRS